MIKEGMINFKDFNFDIESYSFWSCCMQENYTANLLFVCFVLQLTASLLRSKVQLAPPISAEKHNGRANSEIGY